MKPLAVITLLVCLGLGSTSCYYVPPSCAPVVSRPYVYGPPVVMPVHAPCRPGYCVPYYAPNISRSVYWHRPATLYAPCPMCAP